MEEQGFQQFLKRAGKKSHVVEGLINQVRKYEVYLSEVGVAGLAAAGEKELRDYVETLDPKVVKQGMRGLALYYRFVRNESLARLAAGIREERIAKTRKAFKLAGFRGINPADIAQLRDIGIVTVEQMLAAGKTATARRQLEEQTGISSEAILELVKLSDLSRLGAVKSVRARLYYDAGLDTPEAFTQWEPEALRQFLVKWVDRTGFDGVAPLPKEIQHAINTAGKLPKVVQY